MTAKLPLFTDASALLHAGYEPLVTFLNRFTYLQRPNHKLPTPTLDDSNYFICLAKTLEQPNDLPEPLLQALREVEAIAAPIPIPEPEPHLPPIHEDAYRLRTAIDLWLHSHPEPAHSEPPPLSSTLSPPLSNPASASCSSPAAAVSDSPLPSFPSVQIPVSAAASDLKVQGSPSDSPFPPLPQTLPPTLSDPALLSCPSPASSAPDSSLPSLPSVQSPVPAAPPIQNQNSKIENPEADFARLAHLSPVEYDHLRRAEAKRLNLRLSTLDAAVEAARRLQEQALQRARNLEDDAEAERIKFIDLEPWPEPILDAPGLFDQVHDRCTHYLYLPPGAAIVFTLWTAHAHAINAFTHSPHLNLFSREAGSGKTTAFFLLMALTPRPMYSENIKPPVVFRAVDRGQPTLFLDELDTYLHIYPELRGLLNAGHNQGACVFRCEGGDARAFKMFAAIGLAGLSTLAPTLRDRSIVVHLIKAPPTAKLPRFHSGRLEIEKVLAQKMSRWAKDHFDALAACEPLMPPAAYNRLADNWRPLFAIAQTIGGHWPQLAIEAFNLLNTTPLSTSNCDHQPPIDSLDLLSDIQTIFSRSNSYRLFSNQLVELLRALPD